MIPQNEIQSLRARLDELHLEVARGGTASARADFRSKMFDAWPSISAALSRLEALEAVARAAEDLVGTGEHAEFDVLENVLRKLEDK